MTLHATRWPQLVAAVGIAQIIAWGTLYYAIAVLCQPLAEALQCKVSTVFAAFTLGLVASGLVAPGVGRLIDAGQGRRVLQASTLLAAVGFGWLAFADGLIALFGSWVLLGLAMGGGLYDAAFAVLQRAVAANDYRRAVTALTLFGGFASTVFWPATRHLAESFGWRETALAFAVLHLGLCLPLYSWVVPAVSRTPVTTTTAHRPAPVSEARFWGLAAAFAIAAFVFSVLSAHLVTLLGMGGIDVAHAVYIGALIGPMQVVARVVEFAVAGRFTAVTMGRVAFGLLALALGVLWAGGPTFIAALGFALLYGASNGVMTIIRGTVPAELFADEVARGRYGALLGRLAMPAFIAKAGAPFVFALWLDAGVTRAAGVAALCGLAFMAWAGFEWVRYRHLAVHPGRRHSS